MYMNFSSRKPHSAAKWAAIALGTVLLASGASAQDNHSVAATSGLFVLFLVLAAAAYIYTALAMQTIAEKTNTENSWMAWVPIVNIILLLNIAKKPMWWILLLFIPLVNAVVIIMVWMAVAEARNKPSWWGILLIVPLVGMIVPGYLAWSD